MPELPGDQEIPKLFGFPGYEALMKISLRHINFLRVKLNLPEISYEGFRNEVIAEVEVINNSTPPE